jgi:hypothetical protein
MAGVNSGNPSRQVVTLRPPAGSPPPGVADRLALSAACSDMPGADPSQPGAGSHRRATIFGAALIIVIIVVALVIGSIGSSAA